jgi:hypothetical protein
VQRRDLRVQRRRHASDGEPQLGPLDYCQPGFHLFRVGWPVFNLNPRSETHWDVYVTSDGERGHMIRMDEGNIPWLREMN